MYNELIPSDCFCGDEADIRGIGWEGRNGESILANPRNINMYVHCFSCLPYILEFKIDPAHKIYKVYVYHGEMIG